MKHWISFSARQCFRYDAALRVPACDHKACQIDCIAKDSCRNASADMQLNYMHTANPKQRNYNTNFFQLIRDQLRTACIPSVTRTFERLHNGAQVACDTLGDLCRSLATLLRRLTLGMRPPFRRIRNACANSRIRLLPKWIVVVYQHSPPMAATSHLQVISGISCLRRDSSRASNFSITNFHTPTNLSPWIHQTFDQA